MPEKAKAKEVATEEKQTGFDYKNKASFKLSNKFKQYFSTKTAGGGETLSADGLVALAHIKGIWKLETDIIQFPNAENNNVCICKATVGGYDWDPIEEKVIKVEYTDIGDACPSNCNRMVAPSFIRMASTRAIGRALRKYTNMDMLCTEELNDEDINTESMISMASDTRITFEQLNAIKGVVTQKSISTEVFGDIMQKTFNTVDFQSLSVKQGAQLLEILNNYIAPNK